MLIELPPHQTVRVEEIAAVELCNAGRSGADWVRVHLRGGTVLVVEENPIAQYAELRHLMEPELDGVGGQVRRREQRDHTP